MHFRRAAPAFATITYTWNNLPERSFMLELLVDAYCPFAGIHDDEYKEVMPQTAIDKLPSGLLYRVTRKYEKAYGFYKFLSIRDECSYDKFKEDREREWIMSNNTW
jgi:hypothetical protein